MQKQGLTNVYLTDIEDMAQYFAQETMEVSGGDPVLLVIDLDDPSCLGPDNSMYRDPLTFVKEKHGIDTDNDWVEAFNAGDLRYPVNEKDWETSLEVVSSVICHGVIPWDRVIEIRDVEIFEDR